MPTHLLTTNQEIHQGRLLQWVAVQQGLEFFPLLTAACQQDPLQTPTSATVRLLLAQAGVGPQIIIDHPKRFCRYCRVREVGAVVPRCGHQETCATCELSTRPCLSCFGVEPHSDTKSGETRLRFAPMVGPRVSDLVLEEVVFLLPDVPSIVRALRLLWPGEHNVSSLTVATHSPSLFWSVVVLARACSGLGVSLEPMIGSNLGRILEPPRSAQKVSSCGRHQPPELFSIQE